MTERFGLTWQITSVALSMNRRSVVHGVLSWMDETTMEDILQSHMEEFSSESVQELEKTLSTENEESPEVEPLNT